MFEIENNYLQKFNIPERERVFFEAILYCIKVVSTSYNKLIKFLQDENQKEDIMIYVWNFIDSIYRLKCLLAKTPGLKKKENWLQIFLRKLSEIEDFRHIIQHYDREIKNLCSGVKLLLGHLSWVIIKDTNVIEIRALIPGQVRLYKNLRLVNPVGKVLSNIVDLITYYMLDKEVKISETYYELEKFIACFKDYISRKYNH